MASFDVDRYFEAVDAERARRGLTWAGLARELNAPFAHRPDIHPISASTITGLKGRGSLNGNIVVHTLMWLRRAPEEFVQGHPVAPVVLPRLQDRCLPRWDGERLYQAVDAQRRARGLTWRQVSEEIGDFTPEMLRSLRKSVGFPRVMRVLAWLGRPAAEFVDNVPV